MLKAANVKSYLTALRGSLLAGSLMSQAVAAPSLTLAGSRLSEGQQFARDPAAATPLSAEAKQALLRQKIRFVFILFQENRSFDSYFGTYPGANGLLATFPGADPRNPEEQAARDGGSYSQIIRGTDGTFARISPFLIPRAIAAGGRQVPLYPEDLATMDHSRAGMVNSLHFDGATRSIARNDSYALTMEKLGFSGDESTPQSVVSRGGGKPAAPTTLAQHQNAEVILSHVDCDTIPFLWQLADRFTLFDNFHQTTIGPSTPNAIAMIAGQSGETQWALHPDRAGYHAGPGDRSVPVTNDSGPFPGSPADRSPGPKPPYGPDLQSFGPPSTAPAPGFPIAGEKLAVAKLRGAPGPYLPGGYDKAARGQAYPPLTFASLPLSFMGNAIGAVTARDENPAVDLADLRNDIAAIAKAHGAVPWGWYQQGFDREPFDGQATIFLDPAGTPHPSYIVHHNGPQYFGYLGDNPASLRHMHGLADFYRDVAAHALPAQGGVFYVRGGFYNNDQLRTLDPNPDVRATFPGNDDHPGYSDSQISEAQIADTINAIAASPYWSQSAIIVTYDESDGLYDHAPLHIRSWGPDGQPLAGGPRVPGLLISPYAAAHAVSHVYSEHASVIRFIDALFGLTKLADLPDERHGRAAGAALRAPDGSPQRNLGPADDFVPMGDLSEAFDNDRLLGHAPPLPASLAHIDAAGRLPHDGGQGCAALRITPTDYPGGYKAGGESDPPPADFNPRPLLTPGIPASGSWTP